MFSKLVRLFIQFLILLFILALVMAGLTVLSNGPKFNDLYFLSVGIILFSALFWASTYIGDPRFQDAQWRKWFYSEKNPMLRLYRPIMFFLVILKAIEAFFR